VGLFDKLFEKKSCDICGKKIGLLGNRKLEDGNLCKDCARKLSPFFTERRRSTVEEIRAQLAYREENALKLKDFSVGMTFGTDEKVYVDNERKRMIVTYSEDWTSDNPDIIEIDHITDVETEIEDNEEEIFFTDSEGNEKSYNPPRYKYAYEFHITFKVDSPWFDEIRVDLNNGERPESKEDDLYLEWQMKMQELVSIIRERNLPYHPQFGPDVYVMQLRKNQKEGLSSQELVSRLEQDPIPQEPLTADGKWNCPECGTENKGKFCVECGKPRT